MSRQPMKYVKVTLTQVYAFENGAINGWSVDRVMDEWFRAYDINRCHASRDAHMVGGSKVVLEVKEVDSNEAFGGSDERTGQD